MTEATVKKKGTAPKKAARTPKAAALERQAAPRKEARRKPARRKPPASRSGRAFVVVQVHSGIGCTDRQRGVLRSLGLRGPRDRRTLPDVPSVRGMVAAVPHLVRVEEVAEKEGTHS